jgi:FSR family fosmidomycin resistance protein-like MFS transporter
MLGAAVAENVHLRAEDRSEGSSSVAAVGGRKTLIWLSLGHALIHWHGGIVALLYPSLAAQFSLTFSQVGMISTGRTAVGLVASLLGSPLADVVRRKSVLLSICLLWPSLMYLLLPMGERYLFILMVISLMGLGSTIWHPLAMPIIHRLYSKRTSFALSIHSVTADLSQAIAPIVGGVLLTVWAWNILVGANAAFGLAAGLLLIVLIPRQRSAFSRPASTPIRLRAILRRLPRELINKNLLSMAAVSSLKTGCEFGVLTFLPLYVSNQLSLTSAWVGISISTVLFTSAIAQPFVGRIADRFGSFIAIGLGLFVSAVLLFTLPLTDNSFAILALLVLLGIVLFATTPAVFSSAMASASEDVAGSAVGFIFVMMAPGMLIPTIGGGLADHFGLSAAFWLLAVTAFVGAGISLWRGLVEYSSRSSQ